MRLLRPFVLREDPWRPTHRAKCCAMNGAPGLVAHISEARCGAPTLRKTPVWTGTLRCKAERILRCVGELA
jgi:hypothetical protein